MSERSEDAVVLGGNRYGYEDDVYGSCSCGETRRHRHAPGGCPRCGWTATTPRLGCTDPFHTGRTTDG